MRHFGKRAFALLLALLLCLSLFPAALAEEPEGSIAPVEPSAEDAPALTEEQDAEGTIAPVQPGALAPAGDEPQDEPTSGACGDNLTWTLDGDGLLTISGAGDMWDFSYNNIPWESLRGGITSVVLEPGVTSIGDRVFYSCSRLTGITIPEGVTGIGGYAFVRCSSLPNITIPEGVTSIGDFAFASCSSLMSITLPASLTQVGECLFQRCTALTEIRFGGTRAAWQTLQADYDHYSVTVFCSDGTLFPAESDACGDDLIWSLSSSGVLTIAGNGDMWNFDRVQDASDSYWYSTVPWYSRREEIRSVRILEGVTSVGSFAFGTHENALMNPTGCENLASVELPEGLNRIEASAFSGCPNLTELVLPSSLRRVGQCFLQESGVRELELPEGLIEIDAWALMAAGLVSVTVPASVTSIGDEAFGWNGGLLSINVAEGNLYYASRDGILYDKAMTTLIQCPGGKAGEVTIPKGVTSIGFDAFYSCRGLTSVTLPGSVTSIRNSAFSLCTALSEIRFEGPAPEIGDGAFSLVTATAYYLQVDPSWTEDVRQNYGGTITWVGFGPVASGACGDNLTWTLDGDGLLTISGAGDMWDFSYNNIPWESLRESVTSVMIEPGVTSIGDRAFSGCSSLASITIPGTVTGIGGDAFLWCSSLTDITIPVTVTSIGGFAFAWCSSLMSITLPASLTQVGECLFQRCTALTEIRFGGTRAAWQTLQADYDHYSVTVFCSDGTIPPAESDACGDDLIWSLSSSGVLTIAGNGDMWNFDRVQNASDSYWYSTAPWYSRREEIRSVRILEGVTSVGSFAFGTHENALMNPTGCENLASVDLPEGLDRIEASAFSGCAKLTELVLPSSLRRVGQCFIQKSGIRELELPEGLLVMDAWALMASDLVSVTIPASVTSIGGGAFTWTSSMLSINVAEGNLYYASRDGILYDKAMTTLIQCPGGKAGEVMIPAGVERIDSSAFWDCYKLSGITIPGTVTSIGVTAFSDCSLSEIRFEGPAPEIGDGAFRRVTATAYYPQADPSWTEEVRQNYEGTITWVGFGPVASGACGDDLTWTLDGEGTLTISGAGDMWDFSYYSAPWESLRENVTSVMIEPGVTGIGDCAFFFCRNLASITIPEGVTSVGGHAFHNCSSLTSITLPGSVSSIGNYAFSGCSLSSLSLPENVTSIGDFAFYGCRSLTNITIPGSVTFVGEKAFLDCTALTVIRFGGSRAAWQALQADYDHYSVTVFCSDGTIPPAESNACGDDLIWSLSSSGVLTIAGNGDMWNLEPYRAPWYSRRNEILQVRLLNGVTSIGTSAFFYCTSLTSITIPEGVTRIGSGALSECSSLTSVTIPESVTCIGGRAFYQCNMTRITVPAGVASIGFWAFGECSNLREIRFLGPAPENIGVTNGGPPLAGLTATAWYPLTQPGWTEEVRQSYGSDVTWMGYLPGDVNGDSQVDVLDLVRLRKQLAGVTVDLSEISADLNGDWEITPLDLVRLRKLLISA